MYSYIVVLYHICARNSSDILSTCPWHQVILTIVQTLGILTFCYILCLVISDPRYVCVYVPSSECWIICQEIMQRTLDHERALACAYQSNLNPAPGPDTLHGKVTVLF